jgi:hypothetical protein
VAIYVPQGRRRRKLIVVGAGALVVGLVVGVLAGRAAAPTVASRIHSVGNEAHRIASQLRVVSLHEEAGTASLAGGGDAGADLALRRTGADLRRLLRRAPWVSAADGSRLVADTADLERAAPAEARTPAFGERVDQLAKRIEATFG